MQIDLDRFLGNCNCGHTHAISVQGIYIEPKAGRYLSELLQPYTYPVFICDINTKKAAAEILREYFDRNEVTLSYRERGSMRIIGMWPIYLRE